MDPRPAPLTPPPQPSNPQSSPFPAKPLALATPMLSSPVYPSPGVGPPFLSFFGKVPAGSESVASLCYAASQHSNLSTFKRSNDPRSNSLKVFSSQSVTLSPTDRLRKSFICNTYETPRKCCKQKTYGKANSFSCNTYKKQGLGVAAFRRFNRFVRAAGIGRATDPQSEASFSTYVLVHRYLAELNRFCAWSPIVP